MDELNKQSSDSLNQQKSKEDPSSGTELDELNEEPSLEWQEDPRVSFSKLTGKWTLEDEQGNEFEYDGHLKKWILIPDEEAIKQQQLAYVDSKKEVDKPPSRPRKRHRQSDSVDSIKERKQGKVFSPEESNTNSDNNDNANMEKDSNENNNRPSTGIYITNLPPETTEIELEEIFARYGVIAEDLETGEKRIKLYRDENGKLKGDALIIYFKPDSVKLAIEMMDDTRLHFHDKLAIRVQIADRSYKRSSQEKPKLSKQQKTKLQKKIEKLNEKLADWDDDDDTKQRKNIPKRWEKVVILRNVFTLEELENDVTAAFDIKQDILEGCEEIGPVTAVTLFDLEPQGIASVKFQHKEDALRCVQRMNNRFFGGSRLEAELYDGKVTYRKKKRENENEKEKQRLEQFGTWLEDGN